MHHLHGVDDHHRRAGAEATDHRSRIRRGGGTYPPLGTITRFDDFNHVPADSGRHPHVVRETVVDFLEGAAAAARRASLDGKANARVIAPIATSGREGAKTIPHATPLGSCAYANPRHRRPRRSFGLWSLLPPVVDVDLHPEVVGRGWKTRGRGSTFDLSTLCDLGSSRNIFDFLVAPRAVHEIGGSSRRVLSQNG